VVRRTLKGKNGVSNKVFVVNKASFMHIVELFEITNLMGIAKIVQIYSVQVYNESTNSKYYVNLDKTARIFFSNQCNIVNQLFMPNGV
jgi:hypothetical protein